MEEEFVWPPLDLNSSYSQNQINPAVAAWEAIGCAVPQLGRFKQFLTLLSLIDNVLTVTVPDARPYKELT